MSRLAVLLLVLLVAGCQTTNTSQRSPEMQDKLISSFKSHTVTQCIVRAPKHEEFSAELSRLEMTAFDACRCISHSFYNSLNDEMQNRFIDELPENLDVQPWNDFFVLAILDCLQEPVPS